jgi:hypothetical protein
MLRGDPVSLKNANVVRRESYPFPSVRLPLGRVGVAATAGRSLHSVLCFVNPIPHTFRILRGYSLRPGRKKCLSDRGST